MFNFHRIQIPADIEHTIIDLFENTLNLMSRRLSPVCSEEVHNLENTASVSAL